MAVYRLVCGFGHLRADCPVKWSASEPYGRIDYGTTFTDTRLRIANLHTNYKCCDNNVSVVITLSAVRKHRAFPVAGARIWNTLPLHVTSALSLTVFKQHLKLHLVFPSLEFPQYDFSVVLAVSVDT